MPQPPSFLILVPDQFRFDLLGCAGHPARPTPNLDRLAGEGVRFDRCYTVHPLCMPTRATWLTGRAPRSHGVRCNGVPLSPAIPTMTAALAAAGYQTHGIGKLHFNPFFPHRLFAPDALKPEDWPEAAPVWNSGRLTALPSPYYGFESAEFLGGNGHRVYGDYARWLLEREPRGRELLAPPPGVVMDFERSVEVTWRTALPDALHVTSWGAERAEAFLDRAAQSGRPFFLWLSIPDPHPPYTAPEPWCDMFQPQDMPAPARREGELDSLPPHYKRLYETGLPTAGRIAPTRVPEEARQRAAAMVCGMAAQFDAMAGRVLRRLESLGLAGNTVTVFMSDHGQMLGDHWMFSMPPSHLDGSLRVPCIWRFPGRFPAGRVCSGLASHLDFAPTVLDLAGVPIPEGATPPVPEAAGQRPPWPGRSLRPMLCGHAASVQESVIAENDEDYLGLRLRTLITRDHHVTLYAGERYGEMYDLKRDPQQLYNLWDAPEAQGLKNSLLAQLADRFAQTDSVLPRRMGHA